MANTTKLPVEKVLEKIRSSDSFRSKSARREEEMAALDEEIKRMRAQRLRLEANQRKKK
jgi:PBP1b-binding outer membrane lipoprotein LpoB